MASKKALGRGLGAFFPEYDDDDKSTSEGEPTQTGDETAGSAYVEPEKRVNIVLDVPVDNIRPNPHQPRKEFDEDRLHELSESIDTHGLIQPITVRYIGEKRFELISGERRLRAAKLAGIEEIPAYIREVNDEDIISFALIENIQREDLNPIEVALGYQRLIEEADYTQAKVAERVGKSRTTITNMLRLLNLPAYIQAALRDNKISMGHARALLPIEDEEDKKEIFNKVIDNGFSVRKTEQAVKDLNKPAPTTSSEESSSANEANEEHPAILDEISDRLRRTLSTKVNIKPKKNGGEIHIEYFSDDELDRLLDLFDSIA